MRVNKFLGVDSDGSMNIDFGRLDQRWAGEITSFEVAVGVGVRTCWEAVPCAVFEVNSVPPLGHAGTLGPNLVYRTRCGKRWDDCQKASAKQLQTWVGL